jgi:NADH dehydrogenase/putative oxidoreductase
MVTIIPREEQRIMRDVSATPAPGPSGKPDWPGLRRLLGLHADFFGVGARAAVPVLDLVIRLWLAQAFVLSGLVKATNWQTALDLARNEYPVSWMDPVLAAWLGVIIELAGGTLLALGLATRAAALALAALTLVVQFNYLAFDYQLLMVALFGWFAFMGPGPLSLDHALRGLADSALPLAAPLVRLAAWTRAHLGPVYQSLLRAALAVSLGAGALATSGGALGDMPATVLERVLPTGSAATLGAGLALPAALLLLPGLGTRYVAAALTALFVARGMLPGGVGAAPYWVMLFVLLALHGGGWLSVDRLVERTLKRRFPELDGKPAFSLEGLPRVVIVGAGFGGIACAVALRRARVSVTLIDRANFHLFQPLLYQVATAGLSPADIAMPVRPLFRDAFNTRVLLGTVNGIDTRRRQVQVDGREIGYDYLVLATGATHSYFGKDEWQSHAPGLKRIEDATELRRRMLTAFERAEAAEDPAEQRAWLTFLIVGAGPTGVELAGAIAELARHGMDKDFRSFDPASTRVVLVQSGPRVLPTFPEPLSATAQRSLERLGVEVITNSRVDHIDAEGVRVSGQQIRARTVMWAAGVVASPAARWLSAEADRAGRIVVDERLAVPGMPGVFAVGDTAASSAWEGQPVPGLAPAAKQGGKYVARLIRAEVEERPAPGPFRYQHLGSLATIGRKAAVVSFGRLQLWGSPAWWLWGLIHVGFLVGIRNRVATLLNWFWAYLTFHAAVRLITGAPAEDVAQPAAAPLRRAAAGH